MKRKDIKALFSKSKEELTKDVSLKQKELTKVKMAIVMKREKNVRKAQTIRDEIARLRTVLREIELKEKHV